MCKSLTFALQALLVRHEQYMHDAERERLDMTEKIEQLETEKKELEDVNHKNVEENRTLLAQLEGLNTTAFESETYIKSLESTLHSTRQEIRRLETLAVRTHELETQLATLEQEQDILRNTVLRSEVEERSAIQRWKKAERGMCDLQDELERIEREAREERQRHVEVLGRMERQRVVEKELDTSVGRLKATASTGGARNGTNVVSHFVKDILQDNANLQMGIMELKEMLMNSNDEVQALREQLLLHQPVEGARETTHQSNLKVELDSKEPYFQRSHEPPVVSQELHIHHHYHSKKEDLRRPKKKRVSLNTATSTPPRLSHTSRDLQSPRSPMTPRGPDAASAILSQTSVTIPGPHTPANHRWSVQSSNQMSDFAPSSVPSSPQSAYRNSMLFDRLGGYDIDSSRPTSPGSSVDPMSPQVLPYHRKRGSDVSTRNISANFQPHNVIHEEDGDVQELPQLGTPTLNLDTSFTDNSENIDYLSSAEPQADIWTTPFRPTLHRTTSHESIISVSGLDIHTLKSRPSQLTIKSGISMYRPNSGTTTSIVSVNTAVAARPTLTRSNHDSTHYLRSRMQSDRSDTHSISSNGSTDNSNSNNNTNKPSNKLGGWIMGRWGVSPMKSSPSLSAAAKKSPQLQQVDPLKALMGRAPGINQKGPIPGFVRRVDRPPSQVRAGAVDRAALMEVLEEGE
jgi:hypothetical protein